MASFKKVQEMLCLGLIEEFINDEEFVPLYTAFRSSNLPKGRYKNTKFDKMGIEQFKLKCASLAADERNKSRNATVQIRGKYAEDSCIHYLQF